VATVIATVSLAVLATVTVDMIVSGRTGATGTVIVIEAAAVIEVVIKAATATVTKAVIAVMTATDNFRESFRESSISKKKRKTISIQGMASL